MQVKIYVIDIKAPKWLPKLAAYAVPLALVFAARGDVDATPTHFSSGATLTATALQSLNIVTHGSTQLSVGATTYCGATPATTGSAGGYSGAKAMCETACGSPTAHMCGSEELARSAQLGITIARGYFSTFGGSSVGSGAEISDCRGWTSNSSGVWGPVACVLGSGMGPCDTTCDSSSPILCCD